MSNKKSSLSSLSYIGVEPFTPPEVIVNRRNPTTNDLNFALGSLWITQPNQDIYMLLSLDTDSAVWELLFAGSSSGTSTFPCDTGTAHEIGSVLNVTGDANIHTQGSGNTVSTILSNGSNGQVLIGGGPNAVWKSFTSIGNTIVYTPTVNHLNIETSSSIANSFPTDSGTATPSMGVVTVHGTGDIVTTGSGNTITISATDNIIIPGTITIDSLGEGVVQSTSIGLLFSSQGTDGQILISSSTQAPSWTNITSLANTILITNGHNSINLEVAGGGTASSRGFLAIQGSSIAVGSAGVLYPLGKSLAMTKITDIGNNVFAGNGTTLPATFTAPLTGKYYLKGSFSLGGQQYAYTQIVTPIRTYTNFFGSTLIDGQNGLLVMEQYAVADMDMNDVATFTVGCTDTGVNVRFPDTSLSGFFIC